MLHDELDLEAGRLRIKQGGGDAGNRGVRSIAESLGTTDFIRVRIGIGRPPGFTNEIEMEPGRQPKTEENKDYLLRPMTAAERQTLAPILDRAANGSRGNRRAWTRSRDESLQSAQLEYIERLQMCSNKLS